MPNRSLPLYQQLAEDLAGPIRCGTLPAGTRLPSVRATARQRGVGLNTVIAAYRMLEDRGLIEARPQSGYYIRARHAMPEPLASRTQPARHAHRDQLALIDTVLDAQRLPDVIDLALACPRHAAYYPAGRLARLMASRLRRQPERIGQYALPPGSLRLRTQIARRGLALGMAPDPEALLITHGCMEALQLALRAVTQPGDTIALESPSYFNLFPLVASLGLKVVGVETDPSTGLDLAALEQVLQTRCIKAVVCMPDVQNPLGATMPVAAKRALAALAARYRTPVIEDALYAELQFDPVLPPALKAFDREGWVMRVSSFTKTLAPDFRIGWIDPGRFAEPVRRLKFASSIAESHLLQETLADMLESGGYDRHLRTLRRHYEANIHAVRTLIARHFPEGTRATRPAGGFLLWVELPEGADSIRLFEAALAEGITIMPGPLHATGGAYRHGLRLSCCAPVDARFASAIARLGVLARTCSFVQ